ERTPIQPDHGPRLLRLSSPAETGTGACLHRPRAFLFIALHPSYTTRNPSGQRCNERAPRVIVDRTHPELEELGVSVDVCLHEVVVLRPVDVAANERLTVGRACDTGEVALYTSGEPRRRG